MERVLYLLATLMTIVWAFLYFGYNLYLNSTYRMVHVLFVIAAFIILIKMIPKLKSKKSESDIES
jgi:hypothetical protein